MFTRQSDVREHGHVVSMFTRQSDVGKRGLVVPLFTRQSDVRKRGHVVAMFTRQSRMSWKAIRRATNHKPRLLIVLRNENVIQKEICKFSAVRTDCGGCSIAYFQLEDMTILHALT